MHSRRTPADLFFSIDVIVILLGTVLTTWLVNVADASDASVAVHNLVAEGGAGITAFACVALNELFIAFWGP